MYKYKEFTNIVYKRINKTEICMDIITPDPIPKTKIPCAVFFHGGGWCTGNKKDVWGFPLIIDDLITNGIAVITVSYRLYGKNGGKFPDSVEDCIDALIYIDNQKYFNADTYHKAVFGISAGGYMALMSTFYQYIYGKYSNISAIVDMCGPIYMQGNKYDNIINTPLNTIKFIHDFIGDTDYKNKCNPIDILHDSPLKPAVLVVHGAKDECVDVQGSRIFYKEATKNGIYIEYIEVENSLHTFLPYMQKSIYPKTIDLYNSMSQFIIDNV